MSSERDYIRWTDVPYAGESVPPTISGGVEPTAGNWRTYFIKHSKRHGFEKLDGRPIRLAIRDPKTIDWREQLKVVQKTLKNLTERQKKIAAYWGSGPPSKQWIPIVDRLIDTYSVEAPRAARILAGLFAGINDAFVVCWHLKYKWLVARPNQYDRHLATYLCTPNHPTYPSGHATVAGAAEVILSYFFPAERRKLQQLAEECANSRLYAGVHFPADNEQGLRLGRQIGRIVTEQLKEDRADGHPLDRPFELYRNAELLPEDYEQVIPYDYPDNCPSLLLGRDDEESETDWPDPKLFY
ncbi:vanadium-dependent haloperoxidase [Halobacillus salinarum]|uniref:Vanadium-dependent haloperoxidase n=1 Tax=Halobacillus salinarum TaxID=2932257 RepID=A0ABY4EN82_9BACI|nr:vanadium-dependent haloperoxidase [Halobacillus salinarum]UOQ45119.1 vanadium-dependent haloperoxidase [Halobacillus salinarum]